ncbi:MAG: tetratricopeptide repeat protein [Pseudomonadota bacterium]
MARDSSSTFSFDEFEIHVERRELLRDDAAVVVEPRVFDLIVYLVENRNSAVSKDELLEAVWPNSYVSETSLTRCVMKARRALDDDANQQRYIRTVHSHGYRFVGDLRSSAPKKTDAVPTSDDESPRIRDRTRYAATSIPVLVVLLIVVGAVLNRSPSSTSVPPQSWEGSPIAVLPVHNDTGDSELDWIVLGLMNSVIEQISSAEVLQAISADDLVEGLRRLSRTDGEFPDARVAEAAAFQQFGVEYVLDSVLLAERGLYRLRSTIRTRDEDLGTFDVMGDDPAVLAQKLSSFVLRELDGSSPDDEPSVSISSDAFVNEAYVRGRDQLLRGNASGAIDLLSVAVDQAPSSVRARHMLANAWLANGEADRAVKALEDLQLELQQSGARLEEAKILSSLGLAAYRQARYADAEEHYETAIALYSELRQPFREAKLWFKLAEVAGYQGNVTLERAHLETAARLFSEVGGTSNSGVVLEALANQAMDQGDMQAAKAYFSDALAAYRSAGLSNDEAVAVFGLSRVAQHQGDFKTALALAEESRNIARDRGEPWTEALGWRRIGMVSIYLGRLNDAEAAFDEALIIARDIGAGYTIDSTVTQLADLYRMQGRYDEALRQIDEAAELVEASDIDIGRRYVQVYRGRLARDMGDPEMAIALAREALTEEGDIRRFFEADSHYLLALAYGDLGQTAEAIVSLKEALDAARRKGDEREVAMIAATLGIFELAYGDTDLAPGYWGIASEAVPDSFYTLMLEAALSARRGDTREAESLFAQAREVAGGQWSRSHDAWQQLFTEPLPSS